jgi:hypothetical protein
MAGTALVSSRRGVQLGRDELLVHNVQRHGGRDPRGETVSR